MRGVIVKMKKAISMMLLVFIILTSFVGCSNPNKKSAAEKVAEKAEDNSKLAKVDMRDMDAIYEFVKQHIKDLSRENFDYCEVNYLDITGDGTDEAVISGLNGVEWPPKMQIISGDSGEYKRIPSDIPLLKYENKPELRDGFFVVTGKTGGTGTATTVMNLYTYDGSEIINVLSNLEVFYRVAGAPIENIDIERTGEIDGKLTDFIFTVTEYDKVTGKKTIEKKEQYTYNANTKRFDVKSIEAQAVNGDQTSTNSDKETASNNEEKNPASNNHQGQKTVDASELKVGDMINGHTIDKLIYKKGDEFGIGLKGEYTVTGEISYDEDFWGGVIFSTDKASASPTKIKYKFDEEFVCAPPSGTFVIDGNSLNVVKFAAPNSFLNDIKNGKTYKTKLVINDYAFAAKNHTSPGWGCNIVKIIDLEANNVAEKTSGTLTGFTSETINGVQVNYSDCYGVIVPMYNGIHSSALESVFRALLFPSDNVDTIRLNFAVFGELKDIVVTYYKGMDSAGTPAELGTFNNAFVILQVPVPSNDRAYFKVTGKAKVGEGDYRDVEFTLDDTRDAGDYKVIMFK